MNPRLAPLVACCLMAAAGSARAQSFDLGAHLVGSQWSEFTGTDRGVGARIGWNPVPQLGLEADVNWYPADFPAKRLAFSGNRLESIVAVTAGPRLDRLRPFVRLGAGLLRSSGAPGPFACIAIFPPPLNCLLAAGATMPVFELGGGLEFATTGATFLRIDAGDRMLRYPGPTFTSAFALKDQGFFGHALKFTFGGGWRF